MGINDDRQEGNLGTFLCPHRTGAGGVDLGTGEAREEVGNEAVGAGNFEQRSSSPHSGGSRRRCHEDSAGHEEDSVGHEEDNAGYDEDSAGQEVSADEISADESSADEGRDEDGVGQEEHRKHQEEHRKYQEEHRKQERREAGRGTSIGTPHRTSKDRSPGDDSQDHSEGPRDDREDPRDDR